MSGAHVRDEAVARALYEAHAASLLAFVTRLLHNDRTLAEDIVQETLLRAWRNADRIPPHATRQWLFTTARHLVIDVFRARRARPVEAPVDLLGDAAVTDRVDTALDAIVVTDALQSLSDAHRSVIVDCFYRGRTAAEVAAERGLPPGTVRSRLHYALRALGLALQERGVTGL